MSFNHLVHNNLQSQVTHTYTFIIQDLRQCKACEVEDVVVVEYKAETDRYTITSHSSV